jgi:metal-responsive CopG/Arc/MetJ family transcriptional regulator
MARKIFQIVKAISLDYRIWKLVDEKRAFVSRSKFIENILKKYFKIK